MTGEKTGHTTHVVRFYFIRALIESLLTGVPPTNKTPHLEKTRWGVFEIIPGGDLLSHTAARAVPSALRGLTSVFGMGTGVTPSA